MKVLDVELKTVTMNVTALAREAGLSEAVANSPALLRFAERLVDLVMREHGATPVPAGRAGGGEN